MILVFLLLGVAFAYMLISKNNYPAQSNNIPNSQINQPASLPIPAHLSDIQLKIEEIDGGSAQKEYGESSFKALENKPEITSLAQKVKSDFKPEDMGSSVPPRLIKLENGKKILILIGCAPDNCGGTSNVIAYDQQEKKVFILRENYSQTDVKIYGNPSEEIKNLLMYYYLR
jgi:hypothetical protein